MSHTKNHLCDKIWVPEEGSSPAQGQADPCRPVHVMWVTAPSNQPQSPCTAAARSFWRHFYRLAQPTLRTLGQCMFGLAMLFIIAGIALCIWGYVGTAIRPFQIFGPVCIGIGMLIYMVGCVLCCREYPAFEKTLQKKAQQEKARRAVTLLSQPEVIEWIQGEPEVYEEFRITATKVLNNHGLFSSHGNVIANQLCQEVLHHIPPVTQERAMEQVVSRRAIPPPPPPFADVNSANGNMFGGGSTNMFDPAAGGAMSGFNYPEMDTNKFMELMKVHGVKVSTSSDTYFPPGQNGGSVDHGASSFQEIPQGMGDLDFIKNMLENPGLDTNQLFELLKKPGIEVNKKVEQEGGDSMKMGNFKTGYISDVVGPMLSKVFASEQMKPIVDFVKSDEGQDVIGNLLSTITRHFPQYSLNISDASYYVTKLSDNIQDMVMGKNDNTLKALFYKNLIQQSKDEWRAKHKESMRKSPAEDSEQKLAQIQTMLAIARESGVLNGTDHHITQTEHDSGTRVCTCL